MSDIEAYLLEQDEVVNVSVTSGDRHCGIIWRVRLSGQRQISGIC